AGGRCAMTPPRKLLAALAGAVLPAAALAFAPGPVHAGSGDDAAALRAAVAIERARAPAPRQPREAFLAPPSLAAVRLSPDGRNVAYLRNEGKSRSLWLLPA